MDKAHGRVERRRRTSTTARNGLVGWPEVGQVFEGERVRVAGGTGRVAVVYGLTRLRRERADARGPLGRLPGPWGIANGWHGVRDVTRGGDGGRVGTGAAAPVLAAVGTVVVYLREGVKAASKASAARRFGARPGEALALLT